jgi:hypothetical protein
MPDPKPSSNYQQLVKRVTPTFSNGKSAESELDALLSNSARNEARAEKNVPQPKVDRIQQLRELVMNELIPAFVELVDKYAPRGISMDMDASNLLQGGRDIRFEFRLGDYRLQLAGTATPDTIAFQETRYHPNMRGEIVSGPMLSLRRLDVNLFREFVCERLAILARSAMRKS